jgi:hypothetical protein
VDCDIVMVKDRGHLGHSTVSSPRENGLVSNRYMTFRAERNYESLSPQGFWV